MTNRENTPEYTLLYTPNDTRKTQAMPDIWDQLWACLAESHVRDVVYVYRIDKDGRPIRPYLLRSPATEELPEILRDHYGGGKFQILIRRAKKMLLSGRIAIGLPMSKLHT